MTASRTLMGTAARASLATAFIACGATADFTGMTTEANLVDQSGWTAPDGRTLYVISVYAQFDDAADHLTAVFGDTNHVLSVETSDDEGFWQFAPPGGDPGDYNTSSEIAPGLSALYASVTSDSFVTIGLMNSTDNELQNIGIDFTSFNDASGTSAISVDNGSWFITPDDTQGDAGNYTGNRVLIGQFTVGEGEDVTGSVSLQWVDDVGDTQYAYATAIDGVAGVDAGKHDMNGDGIADILWRNAAGTGSIIYAWLVDASDPNNLIYSGDNLFNGTTELNSWEIAGTGDMDGDGLADILWRDPSNRMYVWKTRYDAGTPGNPLTYVGDWLYTGTGLAGWSVESVADMNGDGIADILWRNAAGTGSIIYAWLVDASDPNNLIYSGDNLFNGTTELNSWEIAGTGDMDGDGLADILWRDPSNRMYVWKTRYNAGTPGNPLTYVGDWLYTGTGLAGWSVESVADMNGDGIADILWRNAAGTGSIIYVWLVDASDPNNLIYSGDNLFNGTTELNSWEISGTGDMDGDSLADILWRDPSNRMYVWKTRYDAGTPGNPLTYVGDWLYQGVGLAGWSVENDD